MTPAINLPTSPNLPTYARLTCPCDPQCDWHPHNVPRIIAARVIVRHMETQHGRLS